MNKLELWQRYKDHVCDCEELGLSLDISRMGFGALFFEEMSARIQKAFLAMDAIEAADQDVQIGGAQRRYAWQQQQQTPQERP